MSGPPPCYIGVIQFDSEVPDAQRQDVAPFPRSSITCASPQLNAASHPVSEEAKPLNGFMHYRSHHQKKYAMRGIPQKDISKRLGEEWRKMSDEQKEVYSSLARKKQTQYIREYTLPQGRRTTRKRRNNGTSTTKSPNPSSSRRVVKPNEGVTRPNCGMSDPNSIASLAASDMMVAGLLPGTQPVQEIQHQAEQTQLPIVEVSV
ncbi:hypothetical protein AMATHDRAFT_58456 [Amanita thiersii Skay4041]|uniref:HMG box domain-containing protein n=1 Tax=Amanita thiersii Skay4041 TaxID=703135 RepID=A0A2A9NVF0_9AGAR|nr:hypothetical protein AMATHDRAFT_58456 [Amanita thiersii Skay4041]